jgi:hypothetical protein
VDDFPAARRRELAGILEQAGSTGGGLVLWCFSDLPWRAGRASGDAASGAFTSSAARARHGLLACHATEVADLRHGSGGRGGQDGPIATLESPASQPPGGHAGGRDPGPVTGRQPRNDETSNAFG